MTWLTLRDSSSRAVLISDCGRFTIKRCGPNGRAYALRRDGVVVSIMPDTSDLKAEAERELANV